MASQCLLGSSGVTAMSAWTLWTTFLGFSTLVLVSHGGKDKPQFSEEIQEIIQHLHNVCAEKTGAAEEDILNCENGIFKEDEKLKCYMFCILEESNVADEDGLVDYEMLIGLIPEEWSERVHKMIYNCKHLDTPDKDICQRVFDVHKCTYETDPGLYFLF